MSVATTTLDTVWTKARLLSYSDRIVLRQRLNNSLDVAEDKREGNNIQKLMQLAGSWSEDPRTTDEILSQLRSMRTPNPIPQL